MPEEIERIPSDDASRKGTPTPKGAKVPNGPEMLKGAEVPQEATVSRGSEAPKAEFELEEYKQVLCERRFVMTRFMQAVALYLALSAFAAKEMVEMDVHVASMLEVCFTVLNVLALYVAKHFRRMADQALQRERHFVERFGVRQMYELFWGYKAAVLFVGTAQVATLSFLVWRVCSSPSGGWNVFNSWGIFLRPVF